MSRSFYSDFADHCLRFYVRHPSMKRFKCDADRQNYKAAKDAFHSLGKFDTLCLIKIYLDGDTMADSIYNIAELHGIEQERLWALVARVEKKVAKRRGLI